MNNQFLYKGKKVFAILICIIFIFSSLVMPANANNSPEKSDPGILPDYHQTNSSDKSIIVKYKDEKKISFVKQTISEKLNNYKVNIKRNLGNIDIIETSDEAEYEMVLHELKNNPYIEYAQPDYRLKQLDIGSEDLSSKQWSIANSGQSIMGQTGVSGIDINVQPVWDYQKGNENVIVGVLDSGIDIEHPELKDSIYVNRNEIPGNNQDDDHNGYIDDINGWDFMNSDNSVYDNSEEDFHATHIAGIIVGKHDDKGINGIAPGVKILPLKFMNGNGGFTSDAIEAIRYAKSIGVKVINCSFGDTNYNYALEKEMRDSGILFVCGSGNENENLDSNSFFPASFNIPNKITVAAVNNKGELSGFSNYGRIVDIAAPGENIISTIPEGKFEYASGTSMAAPFVTATAALLWSFNPSYSFSKVKEIIKGSAKRLDTLIGKVETDGMVNAFKASLPGILPFGNGVLTRITDTINVNNFTSGSLSGYSFNDMVPLVDGWVIIADIVKNKIFILNVFSGEVAKEYPLNSSPNRIDFNPEMGKIIVTQRSSNSIALIDVYNDEIKYIQVSGSPLDVVFAKNNYAVVLSIGTSSWEKKISILDWESGLEVASDVSQIDNYGYLACDRNTNNILVGVSGISPSSLTQFVFNEETKALEKKNYVWDMGGNGQDLAISPDGLHAAFACGGGNGDGYTIFNIDATNIKNKFGEWDTNAYPTSVAFSKDSKYIIATNGRVIKLFDVATHEIVETIGTGNFYKVSISNGRKIAFANGGDKLYYYLLSLPSSTTEPPIVTPSTTPTPTQTATSLPTSTSTSTPAPAIIINTSIPELTRMADNIDVNNFSSGSISGYSINDMVPIADGWVTLGDITKNKVFIINALTGDIKKEYQLNGSPDRIDFNPENGNIIATQYSSNRVALIDPYTDKIKYITVSGRPVDVVFAKNNYAVVLLSTGEASYEKKISIIDWDSGLEAASSSDQRVDFRFLACDKATNNILAGVSGTSPSSLTQFGFNENTKTLEIKNSVWDMGGNGQDLAISPDGLHAAFACGGGNGEGYTIWDIDAMDIKNKLGEWDTDAYPTSASFSRDNKYIVTSNGFSIKIFNVATHKLVKTIANTNSPSSFRKVGISNGGKIAYAISEGGKLYYYPINEPSIAIPTPMVLNKSIKGEVHLPNNMTVDEDIQVEVYLQNAKEKVYSTSVVIKKGTHSQEYTLLSPNASQSDKFKIGYRILEGGQSFAQAGLYSSPGTTFDEEYAEDLTIGSNLGNINIELLAKRKISGRVSLPDGKVAPSGGVEVKITAGYKEKQYYTSYVTIAEGQKSSDFELTAYPNDSDNKYILQYTLLKDMDGYFSDGFYNGKGTTVNITDAAPVDIRHNDASNIQIQILKGRTISGTIKLPDYQTASEGGIQVEIMAADSDQDAYYSSMVKIDQGRNSVEYSISVPDVNKSYYVNYFTIASGYVRSGYYLSGSTAVKPDDAGKVTVYNPHVSGINLTLIKAQTLTGTISLPYGIVAPKEGIRVAVTAKYSSEYLSMYTFTTIKEGQNSAQYTLQIPLNHGKYIVILNTLEKGYVKEAYSINFSSTSSYYKNATTYDSNTNSENISLQLISGTDITGEIRLYSGIAPSGGTEVIIFLYGYSGIAVAETVLIPAGNTRTSFTITAPKDDSFCLAYMLPSDESFAFYNNGQMVQDIDSASPIYAANETITGINMVIKSSSSVINDGNSQNQGNAGNVIAPPVLLPPAATATATPKTTPTVTPTPTPAATSTAQPKPTNIVENPVKKPAVGTYKDISGHWAKEYANKLLELGIISGYEDNTIRPNREISRTEAVVIICKSVGLKPAENVKLKFVDNKSIPKWASGYIQTIVDNGILKGYPDNTFKPNAKITRAEVISLVINAFKLGDRANTNHIFKDGNSIAPWAKNYIQKAFELGIITGYKDNSIKPTNNISRAEMFVIIAKSMDIKK